MNKVKYKKLILISMIISSILVITGVSISFNSPSENVSAETPISNALTKFKQQQVRDKKESNKIFVKINNKEFSFKEFKTFKRNMNLIQRGNGNNVLNSGDLKNEFIKEKVIELKAKEENIFVTKKEAKAVVKKVRQQFKTNNNPENQKVKRFMEDYINSLDISEEKYWNDYAVEAYQKILSKIELKKSFVNSFDKKVNNSNSLSTSTANGSDLEKLNKAWEEYQQQLVESSSVELVSDQN